MPKSNSKQKEKPLAGNLLGMACSRNKRLKNRWNDKKCGSARLLCPMFYNSKRRMEVI